MADEGTTAADLEFDGHDVEPAGDIEKFRVFGQKTQRDPPDSAALGRGDRLLGETVIGIGPGFHFDENQAGAVVSDQVNFSPSEMISSFDNAESFPGQEAGGRLFAAAAQGDVVFGAIFQRTPSFESSRMTPASRSSFRIRSAAGQSRACRARSRSSILAFRPSGRVSSRRSGRTAKTPSI
jgi:hypothetical protein